MNHEAYYPQFSKLFSANVVEEILSREQSTAIEKLIHAFPFKVQKDCSYGDFFDNLYNLLRDNYKNEYIYKNEFLLNLLKKEYKTKHTFLQEVRVGKNIADMVVVNGKSIAYEIKTEFDSFIRLEAQLTSYLKVFDKVIMIISENHLKKLELLLDKKYSCVGIYILKSNKIQVHKKETENFLVNSKYYKEIINPSELRKKNISFEELEKLHYKESSIIFRDILKRREKNGTTLVHEVPNSLKSLVSRMKLLKWQKERLIKKLDITVR
jgi:hypothetical protein